MVDGPWEDDAFEEFHQPAGSAGIEVQYVPALPLSFIIIVLSDVAQWGWVGGAPDLLGFRSVGVQLRIAFSTVARACRRPGAVSSTWQSQKDKWLRSAAMMSSTDAPGGPHADGE